MTEFLLVGSLFLLGYIYVGYPLLILLLGRMFGRDVVRDDRCPTVTVIIAAYNEEKHVADKILNVLELDYPSDAIDIIVASDSSSDGTDRIVRDLGLEHVKLLRIEGRRGKTECQNQAAAVATGEVLVFTDATTRIDRGALKAMVRNFADASVGCVAGRLAYEVAQGNVTGHGGRSYWGYEIALREAESAFSSLIGVSGCLYAIRRTVYRPMDPALISDFVVAMVVREQGLRTVLEPRALCYEETLDRSDREISMRVRVTLRSLAALSSQRRFLNPLRYGAFAWQLWSHKLLRYMSPLFCMMALLANSALAMQGRWMITLVLQLVVLSLGLLGFLPIAAFSRSGLLSKPYYFLLTNVASAVSLARFIRGHRVVTWTPLR